MLCFVISLFGRCDRFSFQLMLFVLWCALFVLLAVAIVGGLMINRRIGGDFFQPLSFETCTKDSKHIDLFETAFGERPNLVPILGSEEAVERLFVGGSKK